MHNLQSFKKIVVVPTNKWPHWNFELLHYFDIGPIFSNIYDRSQAIEVHFFSFSSPYYFSQFLNSSHFQGIFSLLSISCETCVSFDWNVTLSCIHISVYVFWYFAMKTLNMLFGSSLNLLWCSYIATKYSKLTTWSTLHSRKNQMLLLLNLS